MPYKDLEPISKQLTIVVGLTVVGFMTFGLVLSYYRNILFDQHLLEIQQQNDDLQKHIAAEQSDLDYYQSAQYKDKYAKETLGRLNPGEKMLIIAEQPQAAGVSGTPGFTPSEQQDATYQETLRQMPVYLHWELFLFQRDKIDELKKGL